MYKVTKLENENKYQVRIEANHDEWEQYVEKAYEKNKDKFNVQGFRKGKAPRVVIEKNYGASIFYDDALDMLFVKEYSEALKNEKDIDPIDNPELKMEKFDETGVVMTATVENMPEVKLGAYKGLTVKKAEGKVEQTQVEKELNQVRERQARFVEVDRPAQNGDIAVIDFSGSVDGKKFDGGTAENYRLSLGSKTFIEGFEDQVVGMKAGDKKDVNVTFPENYQAENLKGKPAIFEVTVHKVEEKQLPDLNDAFASDVSEFETLEDYKKDIEKHLNESLQNRLSRENENNLIAEVVKQSNVEIPKILVDKQLDMFMQDLEMRLSYQGVSLASYAQYLNKTVEELKNERVEQAKETVKTRLVLEAIVKKEKLDVSEEELDAKLNETAQKYKKSLEDYKKSLGDKNISYVQNDILMNKLLKLLMENNTLA